MGQRRLNGELLNACYGGNLDLVKYLLTSPDLKEHADIHAKNSESFINAISNGHVEIIEYLIWDYKIEKTEHVEQYLVEKEMKDILNTFEKRDLEKELQKDLNHNMIKDIKITL